MIWVVMVTAWLERRYISSSSRGGAVQGPCSLQGSWNSRNTTPKWKSPLDLSPWISRSYTGNDGCLKGVGKNTKLPFLGPVFRAGSKCLLDEDHAPGGMDLMDLKEPPSLC